jgi:hypothetical protein
MSARIVFTAAGTENRIRCGHGECVPIDEPRRFVCAIDARLRETPFPLRLALDAMNRRANISRALRGSELPHDEPHVYARNLEAPSGGAVGTARAIAHAYNVFAHRRPSSSLSVS